jgi:hypothetical protein
MRAARAELFVIRPFVHDRRIRESDSGNVGGIDHDRDVPLSRNHRAADVFRSEVVARDKGVLVGTNVVIIVGPIVNAAAAIEARFRG